MTAPVLGSAGGPEAPRAGIDTVVVDYGGVLTNPLPETMVLFAQRVGVDVGVLVGAFMAAARELGESPMAALETGRITEAQMVGRLLVHLPAGSAERLDGKPFGELWFAGRVPNSAFLEFLGELHAGGYRLALLTNNVREWEHRWRAQLPVEALFSLVVNSAHEGVRKPDPQIYVRLLDRLDAVPAQCLFVDDDAANCEAARNLGMHVVPFVRTDQAIGDVRAALAAHGIDADAEGAGCDVGA